MIVGDAGRGMGGIKLATTVGSRSLALSGKQSVEDTSQSYPAQGTGELGSLHTNPAHHCREVLKSLAPWPAVQMAKGLQVKRMSLE